MVCQIIASHWFYVTKKTQKITLIKERELWTKTLRSHCKAGPREKATPARPPSKWNETADSPKPTCHPFRWVFSPRFKRFDLLKFLNINLLDEFLSQHWWISLIHHHALMWHGACKARMFQLGSKLSRKEWRGNPQNFGISEPVHKIHKQLIFSKSWLPAMKGNEEGD